MNKCTEELIYFTQKGEKTNFKINKNNESKKRRYTENNWRNK